MNTQVVDEAEDAIKQMNNELYKIRDQAGAISLRGKTDAESMALANLVKDTTATTKSLNKIGG